MISNYEVTPDGVLTCWELKRRTIDLARVFGHEAQGHYTTVSMMDEDVLLNMDATSFGLLRERFKASEVTP